MVAPNSVSHSHLNLKQLKLLRSEICQYLINCAPTRNRNRGFTVPWAFDSTCVNMHAIAFTRTFFIMQSVVINFIHHQWHKMKLNSRKGTLGYTTTQKSHSCVWINVYEHKKTRALCSGTMQQSSPSILSLSRYCRALAAWLADGSAEAETTSAVMTTWRNGRAINITVIDSNACKNIIARQIDDR